MGITTPLSTNPAMTIGGLTVGVTPLDMAHAYETIAHGGRRVSGTLAENGAPVGDPGSRRRRPALPDGSAPRRQPRRDQSGAPARRRARPRPRCSRRCCSTAPARAAAIGQFAAGKTGTTSNYGDAWFVGWDSKYTVAVWVGYPNRLVPMTTDFNGSPVLGGTFPALIWHDFMISALRIDKTRAEEAASKGKKKAGAGEGEETSSAGGGETAAPQPANGGGSGAQGSPSGNGGSPKSSAPAPSGGEGGGESATPEKAAAPASPPAATPSPSASPPAEGSAPSSSPTGGVSPGG